MSDLKLGSDFGTATNDDWLAAVEKALKGKAADTLVSNDLNGFARQPLYHEANSATENDASGFPGFAPFMRGSHAVANKFLPWHIAQRVVVGRKGADNKAILADLHGGMSAIILDFSETEPIDADALDSLLADVVLDIAPLSLALGKHAMAAAQPIIDFYTHRDAPADTLGFLNLDPLAARVRYGDSGDIDAHALVDLSTARPALRLMTSSGAAYHAMGASVPQELGWMLAGLTAYLRLLEDAGLQASDALSKITLSVAADVDFFAILAKIRAARLLFANIAEAVGAPESVPQIHAETSLRAFSDVDPWVNILRATAATMGAGLAGVDVMSVAPYTATSASDTALARRVARNTQIILQEESHIGHVTDAAGGSWYIEQLTRELAEGAWAEFQKIEAAGGLAAAIETDMLSTALETQRASLTAATDTGALSQVGVREFPNLQEAPLETAKQSPKQNQSYRLAQGFEELRKAAQKSKPKVFIACLGTMANFAARANFATNLYAAGGLHAVSGDGGTDYQRIAEDFKNSTAKIAVICGHDDDYETHADGLAAALKSAGVTHLALAGAPRDNTDIDDYCFAGCAALSYLTALHKRLGL